MDIVVKHDKASLKLHWLVFVQFAKSNPPPLTQSQVTMFAERYRQMMESGEAMELPEATTTLIEWERDSSVDWSKYAKKRLLWKCQYHFDTLPNETKVIVANSTWSFIQRLTDVGLLVPGAEWYAMYAMPGDEWTITWHKTRVHEKVEMHFTLSEDTNASNWR